MPEKPNPLDVHPTPWHDVVLVCRKCGKKLGNAGFGPSGSDTLARALKDGLRQGGRRRDVRVAETRCLGLCPKRAVAVLLSRSPGEIMAVPAGTPAAAVLGRLPRP